MSQQTQIDAIKNELEGTKAALAATLKQLASAFTAQVANIAALNAEIADLKAQQPTLDLTGIQAIADDLVTTATVGQKLADSEVAGLSPETAPATA